MLFYHYCKRWSMFVFIRISNNIICSVVISLLRRIEHAVLQLFQPTNLNMFFKHYFKTAFFILFLRVCHVGSKHVKYYLDYSRNRGPHVNVNYAYAFRRILGKCCRVWGCRWCSRAGTSVVVGWNGQGRCQHPIGKFISCFGLFYDGPIHAKYVGNYMHATRVLYPDMLLLFSELV